MDINQKLVDYLIKNNLKISFSESMTGGMLASSIIDVPGASNVIEESFVTYSNESKNRILNVDDNTIKKYGIVSIEVSEQMVIGLSKITKANVLAGVTGYADKGIVCYSVMIEEKVYSEKKTFKGKRNTVRKAAVSEILNKIYNLLEVNNYG